MHRSPAAFARPICAPTSLEALKCAPACRPAPVVRLCLALAVGPVLGLVLLGAVGCGGGGVPAARIESEAAVERGLDLYMTNCVMCHGQKGDGKGLRWEALVTPPTDFTDPAWSTDATAERVFVSIRTGVPGTAMPAWPAFSEDETWDLVACVLAFDGEAGADPSAGGGR